MSDHGRKHEDHDRPLATTVARWTFNEWVLAYDWAMREHLYAAYSAQVRRRPKPAFIRKEYRT